MLRKAYLSEYVSVCHLMYGSDLTSDFRMINLEQSEPELQKFWSNMSLELFQNVKLLYEQIETQFLERSPDDTMGAQMAVSAYLAMRFDTRC